MAFGEIDLWHHKYWLSIESLKESTHIRTTKRNRFRHHDPLQKHRSESAFSGWRHKVAIVAGALQGDTLALYLFIICLDYVLRTSIDKTKENGFKLTKKSSRWYPGKTITDADYADDIAILVNAPAQAETQAHSLEQAAAGFSFMSMHTKRNICALIKQVIFPH